LPKSLQHAERDLLVVAGSFAEPRAGERQRTHQRRRILAACSSVAWDPAHRLRRVEGNAGGFRLRAAISIRAEGAGVSWAFSMRGGVRSPVQLLVPGGLV